MTRPTRLLAALLLVVLMLPLLSPSSSAATRRRRSTKSSPSAPRVPAWLAPYRVLPSPNGKYAACDYWMSQPGYGALLLFQDKKLARVWEGLHGVSWEPGGTRLLVVERRPGDDPQWFLIDVAADGSDVDRKEPPRIPLAARKGSSFIGWTRSGILYGNPFNPGRRDTVRVPSTKP